MSELHPIESSSKAGRNVLTGRILSSLVVLFLLLDGVMKVVEAAPVVEACAKLGIPLHTIPALGIVLAACTLLYAIPQFATLGAILLTGYLGGAVWTHVRIGDAIFPILFPFIMGAMMWGGLYLREPRLRSLLPMRRLQASPATNEGADESRLVDSEPGPSTT